MNAINSLSEVHKVAGSCAIPVHALFNDVLEFNANI